MPERSRVGRLHSASRRLRPAGLLNVILLLMTLSPVAGAAAQPVADPRGFRPGRILVQPKPHHDAPGLRRLHQLRGHRVQRSFKGFNDLQVIELAPHTEVQAALEAYRASGFAEFAEPDYYLHLAAAPNDPRFVAGSLWHLHNTGQDGGLPDADIDAPEAWDTLHDAGNIIVAVLDTGVRYTHEDLAANMWVNPGEIPGNGIDDDENGIVDDIHGMNAVDNSGDPNDDDGHGTQVASALGAVGNNGLGLTGTAWKVQIMACRFYDDDGIGSIADAIAAMDYARAHGAGIVNASFVSTSFSSVFQSAINRLRDEGIILAAAAGNVGKNNEVEPHYPASYALDNIVAVTSTTRTDGLASFSNIGSNSVDLAAPGSSLHVALHTGDSAYGANSGTSFSTPIVAGALALLRARYPSDSYTRTLARLLESTDPLPSLQGKCVTGGRLNLSAALGPSLLAEFTATPTNGVPPLNVAFTDTSFGTLTGWHWNFGDGTTSNDQHPSHQYEAEGVFHATLTVSNAATSSSTSLMIVVAANYAIAHDTYSWSDPTGMISLPLSNDGISSAQNIPFPFLFYGRIQTALHVAANGMIGFVQDGLDSNVNLELPNPAAPNGIVCPFWDNLSPASGGTVHIGTVGEAPNRRTVISWVDIRYASNPPFSPSFQVLLEETSHQIRFQYQNVVAGRNEGSEGSLATVGIEDPDGLVAALYSHNGTHALSNNQSIVFVPNWTGGIVATPLSNPVFTGEFGGPFTPNFATYTLLNAAASNVTWNVASQQAWLTVSPTSGTLAAGEAVPLTISLNSDVETFFPGSHSAVVSIENTSSGRGNAIRTVHLEVNGTLGSLGITPASPFVATGSQGGSIVSPAQSSYNLSNSGDTPFVWSSSHTQSWVSLSLTGGVLSAGQSVTVSATISPEALAFPAGVYVDALNFTNLTTGLGSTHRLVALSITPPPPGVLSVTPTSGFASAGPSGGPFLPSETAYTLRNSGTAALDWTAASTSNWITLSDLSGSLIGGQQTQVTTTFNGAALGLGSGTHLASIVFKNLTTGLGNTTREIELTVELPLRLRALPITVPGQFEFVLDGNPQQAYAIEYYENPDWIPISTNSTATDGRVTITQPIQTTTRFYRARQVAP